MAPSLAWFAKFAACPLGALSTYRERDGTTALPGGWAGHVRWRDEAKSKSLYHGHRFPAAVISCAVRWYFRFQLSLRDIEELLFERDVTVTYETIRYWCDKFGKGFAHRVKAARRNGWALLMGCRRSIAAQIFMSE
jgi:hypothetical protein